MNEFQKRKFRWLQGSKKMLAHLFSIPPLFQNRKGIIAEAQNLELRTDQFRRGDQKASTHARKQNQFRALQAKQG